MRDDSRPLDAFSWVRPWVPYGDDPFVWYDPSEDMKKAQSSANGAPVAANDTPARDGREQPRVAAEAAQPAPTTLARADGSEEEVWVELPAAEDRPARARRGRGRGRGRGGDTAAVEQTAEAPAPISAPEPEAIAEPEPVAEPAPPARKPRASRAKAKPAAAEAVAEPVAVAEAPAPDPAPAPKAAKAPKVREPDPAEITTPPAAPRKGWWRRG